MKKFLLVLATLTVVLGLAACKPEEKTYEIALVTDVGDVNDGSFNQGAWEGVKAYAEENGLTHKYYKPATEAEEDYVAAINLAIENGAKVVVCPGFMFSGAVTISQAAHPDVKFIVLDAFMETIADNTRVIGYAEHESGFLAGYAAVMDGHRDLGFVGGMSVPAVVRFGYGYIQGANYAAAELGLADDAITVRYWYSNVFWEDGSVSSKATAWYQDGATVIFAAAGGAGFSVMSSAFEEEALVIGVDVDQSANDTVLTSAMKELAASVYMSLEEIYDGTFTGGAITLDASNGGIGLPFENSRFETFTQADYDAIFALLVDGTVVVDGGFEDTLETVDAANPKVNVVTE